MLPFAQAAKMNPCRSLNGSSSSTHAGEEAWSVNLADTSLPRSASVSGSWPLIKIARSRSRMASKAAHANTIPANLVFADRTIEGDISSALVGSIWRYSLTNCTEDRRRRLDAPTHSLSHDSRSLPTPSMSGEYLEYSSSPIREGTRLNNIISSAKDIAAHDFMTDATGSKIARRPCHATASDGEIKPSPKATTAAYRLARQIRSI